MQNKNYRKFFSTQAVCKALFVLHCRYDRISLDRIQKFPVHLFTLRNIRTISLYLLMLSEDITSIVPVSHCKGQTDL